MYDEIGFEELSPWLVAMITLIGFVLRAFIISHKGLRFDESFSIWLSEQSVAQILQWAARIDQHPPLYYLLLHYWIPLTRDTLESVRLLAALFGTATIPVIYLIGKRLSGAMVGVVAAVFLALSPFNIRLAQDTRMYTCLAFNAAVAIYALVWLLTDPRSARPIGSQFRAYLHTWFTSRSPEPDTRGNFSYARKDSAQTGWSAWLSHHHGLPLQAIETDLAWVLLIVFSAATLLSHNTAVLFLLATNVFVLGLILYQRIRKPGSRPAFQAPALGNWVKAQIGILLLWSPWIYTFIQQASRVYQAYWIPKPGWGTVSQALQSFLNETAQVQASYLTIFWILYALVLGFGLVYYRKKMAQFIFLAALFAIPFLGELIVSLRRPIFLDRTLIWITIPLFLLLAAGIAQLRFRILMVVVLGILCTNNLFSDSDYYRSMQIEDWSGPARNVAAFAEKDDLVLFNATWAQLPFDYYFPSFNIQSVPVEEHGVPVDLFASGVLEPKMTESDIPRLLALLDGHDRVWLVYSHYWDTDPLGLIPQTLAAQRKLIQQRDFYGVQVQLYGPP